MTESELYQLIAEALEVDTSAIQAGTVVAEVEDWGSLGWLTIMALLDERAGATLSSAEIQSVTTVAELTALLHAKGVVA